jgi:hypothetical protein
MGKPLFGFLRVQLHIFITSKVIKQQPIKTLSLRCERMLIGGSFDVHRYIL